MVFGSNELPQHAFLWDQRGINGYKIRKPAAQVCHAARIGAGRQLVNIIFPNPHLQLNEVSSTRFARFLNVLIY